jgi:DNA-binding transcriptional LysR family regulator
MNNRQLKYFCEVVDVGTITGAAKRLFVAPTAITMQIAQLEEDLGGELFDRKKRPMALTSLGSYFFPRAKEILRQTMRLEEETRGLAAGNLGWIGIGFVRSTIYSLLPEAVRCFRQSYPKVQIDLLEMLSEYQPENLGTGRIQIGISRFLGIYDRPAGLVHTLLHKDPFVAVLPHSHPLAGRPDLCMSDLAGEDFICYPKDPRSDFRRFLLEMLYRAGLQPRVGYEAIEIQTALGLAAAGLGYTLVGQSVAKNNRTDVAFIPIRDLAETSSVVAITNEHEENRLVQPFLNILMETIHS